mmetsp:Transcript_7190/g.21934  ORF Transcript_7190/g.21934 Transcript_7190/m.21934 type:complete len:178 (+) Transcript_7190:56-589(+)
MLVMECLMAKVVVSDDEIDHLVGEAASTQLMHTLDSADEAHREAVLRREHRHIWSLLDDFPEAGERNCEELCCLLNDLRGNLERILRCRSKVLEKLQAAQDKNASIYVERRYQDDIVNWLKLCSERVRNAHEDAERLSWLVKHGHDVENTKDLSKHASRAIGEIRRLLDEVGKFWTP